MWKPNCIIVDKVPSIQARNTNQTENFWWSASALADHRKLYICLMPEMHRNACHCIDMRFESRESCDFKINYGYGKNK